MTFRELRIARSHLDQFILLVVALTAINLDKDISFILSILVREYVSTTNKVRLKIVTDTLNRSKLIGAEI